jgi:hypothetical protein
MNETSRKTGNGSWRAPVGPISRNISSAALELKALIQRGMSSEDMEQATQHCNTILCESERVAELETSAPVVLLCASIRGGGKKTVQ